MFLSTHMLPVVEEIATKVGSLYDGDLAADGPPGEFRDNRAQLRKMDLMRAFCLLRSNKIRHKLPTNPDIRFSNTRQFRSNSVSLRVPVSHYPERAYP